MDHIRKFNKKTFASLHNRNYRLYFIGQTISFTGTWMQTIALGLLVLNLTGSGTTLGIILALQFLPSLFLAPFAGVLIDRFSKRKLIFLTHALAGLLALILGLLILANMIHLWMIYFFTLALGIVTAFDNPARHAFIVELVGKDTLKNAITLNQTTVNFARIIGPAIAGTLAVTIGFGLCFIINAISYIAVLIMLFLLDTNTLHIAPRVAKKGNQFLEGVRYIRSHPILMDTLIMISIVSTLTYNFSVVLPLFAQFTFHSNTGYAILTCAMSVGAVIGGLLSAGKSSVTINNLRTATIFFGISMLATSLMPTLITATLMMIIVGFCSVNFISNATTLLQLEATPHMRGRVMSLWTMAFLGSTPIGAPIIGWIGEHFGARWGIAIGGFAALTAAAISATLLKRISRTTSSPVLPHQTRPRKILHTNT